MANDEPVKGEAQSLMAEVEQGCTLNNVKTAQDAINHICLGMAQNYAISQGFGLRAFALAAGRHEKQLVELDVEQATARQTEGGSNLASMMRSFAAAQSETKKSFAEALTAMKEMVAIVKG